MTIRRLVLLRHAKSPWKGSAHADHERPLNERGRTDAPRVGRRIVELGWSPEHILCSDARRTQETYELMKEAFTEDPPVEILSALYNGGVEEVLDQLHRLPNEMSQILAVGHNPGWEEMTTWLTGERVTLKTANAALVEHEETTSWQEACEPATWRLVELIVARDLAAKDG